MRNIERIFIILILTIPLMLSRVSGQSELPGAYSPKLKNAFENLLAHNANNSKAYAVFDWDNTCIYGDVQENLFLYQLENLLFKMTPDEFKYAFTHFADNRLNGNMSIPDKNFADMFMNSDGRRLNISLLFSDCYSDYQFLFENYIGTESRSENSLDEIRQTIQYKDFIAKMFFTYYALYESFPSNVSYTWIIYISATGFTEKEYKTVVENALDWGIKKEIKRGFFNSPFSLPGKAGVLRNSNIGVFFLNALRPIPEIATIFKKFREKKIPVYICSASMQDVVEVIAENPKYGYNLPENHVLGMRLQKDKNGRYISQYDFGDGYEINGNSGKSANINSVLVKKYKANPVMVAGDSDGDYFMMTQFSGLSHVAMISEFDPLQLILIVNRLKGGKIGELCQIALSQEIGQKTFPTKVVLQGRDENSGVWIADEKTIQLGTENLRLLP